jgi:hypothetical protein
MRTRHLFLLLVAYLTFDLADPVLPGAFSFEVRDSEVEEAVHVQRRSHSRETTAPRPAPEPGRPVRPDDSRPAPRPVMGVAHHAPPAWQAPRSAVAASTLAPAADDH